MSSDCLFEIKANIGDDIKISRKEFLYMENLYRLRYNQKTKRHPFCSAKQNGHRLRFNYEYSGLRGATL